MDFSVSTLNKMEENVNSTLRSVQKEAKVQSVEELSPAALAKLNKGPMSKMIIDLAKLIKENVRVTDNFTTRLAVPRPLTGHPIKLTGLGIT